MSKHTAGPWTLLEKELAWWVMPPKGEAVQIVKKHGVTTDNRSAAEVLANAVLIAAAPELLAALEGVSSSATSYGEGDGWPEISKASLTQARAAIIKATGNES